MKPCKELIRKCGFHEDMWCGVDPRIWERYLISRCNKSVYIWQLIVAIILLNVDNEL